MSDERRRSPLDSFYPQHSETHFFEAIIDVVFGSQFLFDEQRQDLVVWVLKSMAMPEVKAVIDNRIRARLGNFLILMYAPTAVREQYRLFQVDLSK